MNVRLKTKGKEPAMFNDYEINGDIATILHPHRNGSVSRSYVLASDIPMLEALGKKWYYHNKRAYVFTFNGKRIMAMHRMLLGIMDNPDLVGHHKDNDPGNNVRTNIEAITQLQNLLYAIKNPTGNCGYWGVSKSKRTGLYKARTWKGSVGVYNTAEDAARAVNRALYAPGDRCDFRLNLISDPFGKPEEAPHHNTGKYNPNPKFYVTLHKPTGRYGVKKYFERKYTSHGYFDTRELAEQHIEQLKKGI